MLKDTQTRPVRAWFRRFRSIDLHALPNRQVMRAVTPAKFWPRCQIRNATTAHASLGATHHVADYPDYPVGRIQAYQKEITSEHVVPR